MLTGELVRPRLRRNGSTLTVDMVDVENRHWQRTASDLIALFQRYKGNTQAEWELALEAYEGERLDYIVIRGLAKVLSDAASFAPVETRLDPVEARERLFARGPVFVTTDLFNPLTRNHVVAEAAAELGLTPDQLDNLLFADRYAAYRLVDTGPAWKPADLLERYNLELARGALYWATEMQIEIHDTYKDFWRYVKLFKLMFEARPLPDGGYHVTLDGPISPFVKSSQRYGRQFAAFLPALFLCERWQMAATVQVPQAQGAAIYQLDDTSPLRTHFKRSGEFDSALESDFAADFESKFGGKRGKWLLSREDEVLLLGDTVMIPDFAVTNKRDGRRALIEIVGFWHPDYLRRKVEKVRAAHRRDLILLIYEGVNLAAGQLRDVPGGVLYFKTKPVLKDVMAAVENFAE